MRNLDDDERKRILRDGEKVVVRRKLRFTDPRKQSRMIEGVSVAIGHAGIGDYDELLREAIRVALRVDTNPTDDSWQPWCSTRQPERQLPARRLDYGGDRGAPMAAIARPALHENGCRPMSKNLSATAASVASGKVPAPVRVRQRTVAAMASAAARLLRAYATQVEALRRLRNGNSQTVRVEHVYVNEGGQVIIGNVRSGTAGG